MKLIYKYILLKFIKVFFIVFIAALSLFYVIDFFNNLSTLISNNVKPYFVIYYYLAYTPKMVYVLLPFVFAISSLISLGYMAYNNEILAIKNSGISTFKIGIPIALFAIFLVIFMILLDNIFVPYTYDKALLLREIYIENKNQNLWAQKNNIFVNLNSLIYKEHLAGDVKVYFVSADHIKEVIYSKLAKIDSSGLELINPLNITLNPNSIEKSSQGNLKLKNFKLVNFIKDLEYHSPNIYELYQRSLILTQNKFLYISQIVFKIIYSFSIITMLPMLLFMSSNISARKDDFVRKVFFGTVYSLIFLGLLMLLNSMAQVKIINPIFPIFSFSVVWFLFFLEKVIKN